MGQFDAYILQAIEEFATEGIQVTDQDGNALYCLAVDESTYTREEGEALDLMVPAVLREGNTFLAVEDVLRLHDLKLEVR